MLVTVRSELARARSKAARASGVAVVAENPPRIRGPGISAAVGNEKISVLVMSGNLLSHF